MADFFLVIRHNWAYESKMCDVFVHSIGIATSLEEAKTKVDEAIEEAREDMLDGIYELQPIPDWEVDQNGRHTKQDTVDGIDYEIIPMKVGFDKHTRIIS